MTDSTNTPKLAANDLTIVFGALATILAFAAIIVGICQYRRMPSFETQVLQEDLEMQPIVASSSINDPTRSVSAAISASSIRHAPREECSSPSMQPNTPPPPFTFKRESNAPPSRPAMIASKQHSGVQIDLALDQALIHELEPKVDEGAKAKSTNGAKDDNKGSIPATSYLEYELPDQ
ncbi:hypothetical protein LTR17_005639 [Elasticomyces elasticus]|nr:hypothetical protein LTR17_005639 [Elasticomyces elasticus]